MATVQESINVDVPVSKAYNQWTQFEDFPHFMSGVDSVRQLDDTTVHFETSIAGVKRQYDAQITVQEPDQRVTWESLNEPRNAGTVWFEPLGPEQTKVNVELTWEPESAVEKIGAAVGLDSRQVASDLKKFKKFIESQGTETGAWRESVHDGEVDEQRGAAGAAGGTAGMAGAAGAGAGLGGYAAGTSGTSNETIGTAPSAADDATGYSAGPGMDATPGRTYESGDAYDAAATERPVDADPDMAVDAPYGDSEAGEPRNDTRQGDTRRDETPDR
ncbi:SRPBCC family protein [Arthrobacter pascens]|uniref:SRPBCC family protein n=1 Tax=Arthrobacter pascens TaxID=1677 RepID=UPI00196ACECE|nr:SRPBCC family protein [Arthrobacter pascens]MBN3496227.1 SRPBCC family protein [Arthrobacter pascens]